MNYSVEVEVYKLGDTQTEFFQEVPLEVTFDIENDYDRLLVDITGYFIDGKPVKLSDLNDHNPGLRKQIDTKISDYMSNNDLGDV